MREIENESERARTSVCEPERESERASERERNRERERERERARKRAREVMRERDSTSKGESEEGRC